MSQPIPRIRPRTKIRAKDLDAIGQAANAAQKISVMAPLAMQQTTAGLTIYLNPIPGGSSAPNVGSSASPKVLAEAIGTQNTDTWARGTDKKAVTVKVMTDVYWSSPSLYARFRTFKFDSTGNLYEISGEGAGEVIFTAETC